MAQLSQAIRRIFEAIPAVIWSATPDGAVDYASPRFYEATGIDREQLFDDAWTQIVHPDDLERAVDTHARAVSLATGYDVAIRLRRADGGFQWIRSVMEPMFDDAGRVERFFGIVVDVESNVRTDAALRQAIGELAVAERGFRMLADAVPQIVWTADASGSIDWYNEHWYAYTGQTKDEAAGWGWQAVHHPEDFPKVMERWPESIATGKPFEMEFRLRGADGRYRWFLTRIAPVRNEEGAVARWYGTNADIDDQRRMLERSEQISQTLRGIFLPKAFPVVPGLHIDAEYISAESDALVGGDWYDAFRLADGSVGIAIGDVTGHGLQASIAAGQVRQAVFAAAFDDADPARVLGKVNRMLMFQGSPVVTAFFGIISADRRSLTYASAGHPPPMLATLDTRAQLLEFGQPPLGYDESTVYIAHTIALDHRALLVLYTDGITEFERDIGAAEIRMADAVTVALHQHDKPGRASELMAGLLHGRSPSDDAALMLVRIGDAIREEPRDPRNGSAYQTQWRFHSSDAYSAHVSRGELMKFINLHAPPDSDTYTTELILGELLANTVEHAPGMVEIELDWRDEMPRLRVRDNGPGLNNGNAHLPQDPLAESGRGIFLVRALAEEVQIAPHPNGTEIQVTLPLRRPLSP